MSDQLSDDPLTPPELLEFRRLIDALDDKIIELLIERMGVIQQVGELKRRIAPNICPLRAGREAEMVRRVMEKFQGSKFPPAAAAAIWRTLIGASTAVENPLSISAYTPNNNHDLYWMAREYFGPFLPVGRQPHVKRVIGDVIDGKASIGIVPLPRGSDTDHWWMSLMQQGAQTPKIFAHVPFTYYGAPTQDTPAALAIASIAPEPTGDDVSLLVIAADGNLSQNKLQTAFAGATLDANWIAVATEDAANRYHLLQIQGFVSASDQKIKNLCAALGNSIRDVYFLGAYAKPIIVK